MKICGECERYFKCKDIDLSEDSTYAEGCPNYTPIDEVITNFEDITSSPGKLAKFINNVVNLGIYHEQCFIPNSCDDTIDCEECITKWLNKPKKKDEAT